MSAELIAARWGLTREQLDEYSARSHRLAAASDFSSELVDVGVGLVDETIRPTTTVESLAGLKPAFYDEEVGQAVPARSSGG